VTPRQARNGGGAGASEEIAIVGPAFADDQPPLGSANVLVATLPESPLGPLRIIVPAAGTGAARCETTRAIEPLAVEDVDLGGRSGDSDDLLARITLSGPGHPKIEVLCQVLRRVPVVRQLRDGRVRERVLAVCHFRVGGEPAGIGWAEATR
jgi:hypothetical protein